MSRRKPMKPARRVVDPAALTEAEKALLDEAETLRREAWLFAVIGLGSVAAKALIEAEKTEEQVEQAQKQRADDDWRAAMFAEVRALEASRGHTITEEVDSEGKRYRAPDRDGLRRLYLDHAISERQWKAGKRYRELFEMLQGSVRSGLNFGIRGSRTDPGGEIVEHARRELASIEKAVLRSEGKRALDVLRDVAGEGKAMRELGGSADRRKALTAALKRALDVVAETIAGRVAKIEGGSEAEGFERKGRAA